MCTKLHWHDYRPWYDYFVGPWLHMHSCYGLVIPLHYNYTSQIHIIAKKETKEYTAKLKYLNSTTIVANIHKTIFVHTDTIGGIKVAIFLTFLSK